MDSVRIAMLGGGSSRTSICRACRTWVDTRSSWCTSQRADTAASFAQRWNIPETSDSFDRTIARDDIDLYLIALPNFLHRDIAIALARAGRNQVCTKPLARNGAEAREILNACRTPPDPRVCRNRGVFTGRGAGRGYGTCRLDRRCAVGALARVAFRAALSLVLGPGAGGWWCTGRHGLPLFRGGPVLSREGRSGRWR